MPLKPQPSVKQALAALSPQPKEMLISEMQNDLELRKALDAA